jgi:hypothetical protein
MSTETSTSLLDDALTCIGRRITLILLDPGDKGKNYVASLHNEVVGFHKYKISGIAADRNFRLARCRLDNRPSIFKWYP